MHDVLKKFDLSGRTALVTGSSAGIGFALARGLAQAGATVVLNARNQDKLDQAAAQLRQEGAKVHTAAFDVTELTDALVKNQEFSSWLIGRTPSRRWGDVEDLVGSAIFLASAASDFVNGHILYVDGGVTATL